MTETASETAQRLIDQSIAQNAMPRAPWTPELAEEFLARCQDSAEERIGAEPWEDPLILHDFWGVDNGSEWRVVLEQEVR